MLGVVKYIDLKTVKCSCGFWKRHDREKVREDWVDRHFAKRHQGQGIRL